MAICNPNCDDGAIKSYVPDCSVSKTIRKGGLSRFILLDCDVVFDDISSESEWESLNESQYSVSPSGIGSWGEPDVTEGPINCGPDQVTDETQTATFVFRQFDNESFGDLDYEFDLKTKGSSKTVIFIDCEGRVYYNRNWQTGENPGFGELSVRAFRQSERGDQQTLNVTIQYNVYNTGFKVFELTDDLKEAIFGTGS